jgi:non-ribosomal peptide synthetase component F
VPDQLVAINMDRSLGMIVGLLGILKSGAAYVPIDPNFPPDRQQYIVTDARATILVTSVRSTSGAAPLELPPGVTVIRLEDTGELAGTEPFTGPAIASGLNLEASPRSLAYVLYTSGSTGKQVGRVCQV